MQPLLPYLSLLSLTYPSTPSSSGDSYGYPTATFLFTPQPSHCNAFGNLHGGATATLFDFCTTLALLPLSRPADGAHPSFWLFLGVSRTLSVTYLRPAPEGEAVTIACTVLAIGRRTAAIRGEMRRKADGMLLATCEHDKVNTDPDNEGGGGSGSRAKL